MIWQGRVHDPPPSRFAGANTEHRIDLRGWGRNAAPKVTIRARCFVASQHRDDDRAELSALRFLFFHRAAVSRRQDCFKFDSFKFGCHQSDSNSSPTSLSMHRSRGWSGMFPGSLNPCCVGLDFVDLDFSRFLVRLYVVPTTDDNG